MGKRTNTILQSAFFSLAKVLPEEDAIKYMKEKATPVSYTHLDVYKRQVHCCKLYPEQHRRGSKACPAASEKGAGAHRQRCA